MKNCQSYEYYEIKAIEIQSILKRLRSKNAELIEFQDWQNRLKSKNGKSIEFSHTNLLLMIPNML